MIAGLATRCVRVRAAAHSPSLSGDSVSCHFECVFVSYCVLLWVRWGGPDGIEA